MAAATPAHATVRVIATGAMPGWQITLIAVIAVILATATAVLLDRAAPPGDNHRRCIASSSLATTPIMCANDRSARKSRSG